MPCAAESRCRSFARTMLSAPCSLLSKFRVWTTCISRIAGRTGEQCAATARSTFSKLWCASDFSGISLRVSMPTGDCAYRIPTRLAAAHWRCGHPKWRYHLATRLHLQQLDLPSDYEETRRLFEIEMVKDKKFEGQRILVDNRQFENCEFRNCNFVYSGGHFAFANCVLEESCVLSPTGSAYKALRLYAALLPQLGVGVPPIH
jgi:hypothetical protein